MIYQGAFAGRGWRGRADFLERVERTTGLGAWGYEAVDTKLSRAQALPHHVLQLSVYSQAIERSQGVAPEWMHLELGSGRRDTIRVAGVGAYVRRRRRPCDGRWTSRPADRAVPLPALRDLRRSSRQCADRWRRRTTFLGDRRHPPRPRHRPCATPASRPWRRSGASGTACRCRGSRRRRSRGLPAPGPPRGAQPGRPEACEWEPRTVETGRGLERLPAPSDGDVFLDLEGATPSGSPSRS